MNRRSMCNKIRNHLFFVDRDLGAWDESRQAAIDHFGKHRTYMHSTTAQLVEKDLKI